jgi:hypothetical protein
MITPKPRLRKRLARALRALSYRVDPPPAPPPGTPTTLAEIDAARAVENQRTDRVVNEMLLRGYLEQALGRYQPIRLPGQA